MKLNHKCGERKGGSQYHGCATKTLQMLLKTRKREVQNIGLK
jgi:hypothetical protein